MKIYRIFELEDSIKHMILQSHHFQNFSSQTSQYLNFYIWLLLHFKLLYLICWTKVYSLSFTCSVAHAVGHPDNDHTSVFLLPTFPGITICAQCKHLLNIYYVAGNILGSQHHALQSRELQRGQEALNQSYSASSPRAKTKSEPRERNKTFIHSGPAKANGPEVGLRNVESNRAIKELNNCK